MSDQQKRHTDERTISVTERHEEPSSLTAPLIGKGGRFARMMAVAQTKDGGGGDA